ncbi:hypothetical protein [Aquimarina pacifica]|uniref:hypothetical protein n=1 Tax=Aquimarina pacifica TaxID=1296415 RepID=UPI0004725DD4|nr:hypothetical protein [Aquimarina pacifica]
MKTIYILVFFLLVVQTTFGQFVHVHINNNDATTRRKLATLIGIVGGRNASLGISNKELEDALKDHKEQIELQYSKNQYDKSSSFIAGAGTSAVLSLGASAFTRIPRLPYMTSAKREYLDMITMDKALLLALQSVSTTKIKSSKRQEIYRLRSKLLREFSKNDRDARQTLYMSAAGLLIINFNEFADMYNQLKQIEIAL